MANIAENATTNIAGNAASALVDMAKEAGAGALSGIWSGVTGAVSYVIPSPASAVTIAATLYLGWQIRQCLKGASIARVRRAVQNTVNQGVQTLARWVPSSLVTATLTAAAGTATFYATGGDWTATTLVSGAVATAANNHVHPKIEAAKQRMAPVPVNLDFSDLPIAEDYKLALDQALKDQAQQPLVYFRSINDSVGASVGLFLLNEPTFQRELPLAIEKRLLPNQLFEGGIQNVIQANVGRLTQAQEGALQGIGDVFRAGSGLVPPAAAPAVGLAAAPLPGPAVQVQEAEVTDQLTTLRGHLFTLIQQDQGLEDLGGLSDQSKRNLTDLFVLLELREFVKQQDEAHLSNLYSALRKTDPVSASVEEDDKEAIRQFPAEMGKCDPHAICSALSDLVLGRPGAEGRKVYSMKAEALGVSGGIVGSKFPDAEVLIFVNKFNTKQAGKEFEIPKTISVKQGDKIHKFQRTGALHWQPGSIRTAEVILSMPNRFVQLPNNKEVQVYYGPAQGGGVKWGKDFPKEVQQNPYLLMYRKVE